MGPVETAAVGPEQTAVPTPAHELAPLYTQRWEFEGALNELKVHQRGPRVVLRSKTPDGVTQEIYGHLCVHYAIRWLMHTVALEHGHDPDRISFTRTLRAARRTTPSHAGFPPKHSMTPTARQPKSCSSSCSHQDACAPTRAVVKRKMSGYPVKRPEHRKPPNPTKHPHEATTIPQSN